MAGKILKRKASTSIRVDPDVRALRVYPVEGSKKALASSFRATKPFTLQGCFWLYHKIGTS